MIIGSGMLARTFSSYAEDESVLIFASGVSNSLETCEREFLRERRLLVRARSENQSKVLVYFGTCSVYDPDRQETPYVLHKLEMEQILKASTGPWLVLRLPLVVGRGQQGSSLTQFLHSHIVSGEPFEAWAHASRYPIDAADALQIGSCLINDKQYWNQTFNIALRRFSVLQFIQAMEKILAKPAIYSLIKKGSEYDIPCSEAARIATELGISCEGDYLASVLAKYFGSASFNQAQP